MVELCHLDGKERNVKRFHRWYAREHGGERGCTWVKKMLQERDVAARRANGGYFSEHAPRKAWLKSE